MASALALAAAVAALAGAAAAQTPPVSPAARQAAVAQMVVPTGASGCVMQNMESATLERAIQDASSVRPVSSAVKTETERLADQCTGRPNGYDPTLVSAVLAALDRTGFAIRLAYFAGLGQKTIDDAWRASPPDDQAPYLTAAKETLRGGAWKLPDDAAVTPYRSRLNLRPDTAPDVVGALHAYLFATAVEDLAESQIASIRPKTPR